VDALKQHPILRGVKDIWVQAGGYVGKPTSGEILTMAQPLNGMTPDSPADATKPPMPSEWTRSYKSASGKEGRVFTSLYGTSEDITNEGYRRLLVNGIFWALGLEDKITADLNIAFVGAASPTPSPAARTPAASNRRCMPASKARFPRTTTRRSPERRRLKNKRRRSFHGCQAHSGDWQTCPLCPHRDSG
jgi:hypothetical protein